MNKVRAYHFTNGWQLRDGRKLVAGHEYRHNDILLMCRSGLHASIHLMDALKYANGSVLSLVDCYGTVIYDTDKLVCTRRRVVDSHDVGSELRLFACWCIRRIWNLLNDKRSKKVVIIAEQYALGNATVDELYAARAAAMDAARDAAMDAAWAAAIDAARDAARAAQRNEFQRVINCIFAGEVAYPEVKKVNWRE